MTTREQISRAQDSRDLGEVGAEELGDVDVLRACGMVGQGNPLGLAVFRWRYSAADRELPYIARTLVDLHGYGAHLVYRVLKHLADDGCRACGSTGFEMLPNAPIRGDVPCAACGGTGRVAMRGDEERDLVEHLARLEREAGAAIMRKLAREIADW